MTFMRLPRALCAKAVVTALSTPPESALMAVPRPTVFRMDSI
jgi:hypothetical protein